MSGHLRPLGAQVNLLPHPFFWPQLCGLAASKNAQLSCSYKTRWVTQFWGSVISVFGSQQFLMSPLVCLFVLVREDAWEKNRVLSKKSAHSRKACMRKIESCVVTEMLIWWLVERLTETHHVHAHGFTKLLCYAVVSLSSVKGETVILILPFVISKRRQRKLKGQSLKFLNGSLNTHTHTHPNPLHFAWRKAACHNFSS